jgi:hypothetical protein
MSTGRLGAGDTAIQPTIFDAKGDLLTATAADTPARLAVGNSGETLVADSSTSTGLRWQAVQAAGRNAVINGDFAINQRNFNGNVTADTLYTLDRWVARTPSGVTQFSVAPSSVAPTGFSSSVLITSLSARSVLAADYFAYVQMIEGTQLSNYNFGTSNAATFTLSFWVRSSLTGTFAVAFTNGAYNRTYVTNYTINAANTWEKKSITLTGDTTGTWVTDTTLGLQVRFDLGSGSNAEATPNAWGAGNSYRASGNVRLVATNAANLYLTGIQLELGSVATPFTKASGTFAGELAACQRYFQILGGDNAFEYFCIGSSIGTTDASGVIPLKATMRGTPTLTFTTASNYRVTQGTTANTATVVQGDILTKNTINVQFTVASGLTAGNANRMIANNTTAATISISAEL